MTRWIAILVLSIGCSSSPGASGDQQGSADANDVVPGGACDTTTACPANLICDPATKTCAESVACQSHDECGPATHCSAEKTCARSGIGTPCSTDGNCRTGESCIGQFCGCNGEAYTGTRVAPNVLVVLDRSSSMNESIAGGTKWSVAKSAISKLLASAGDEVRFGLAFYPGTALVCANGERRDCYRGYVEVAPGPATAGAIDTALSGVTTCSLGTPTAEMLASLASEPSLKDSTRNNYVLLITDGQSSCADPQSRVEALRQLDPAVKTFVIGFGSGVDTAELSAMATAGGTAPYFLANDAQALADAFDAIAGSVGSCTYSLSAKPGNLSLLYVYQDQAAVDRDTTRQQGWDYDAVNNQVIFYGSHCDALRSGAVKNLAIVYGCPKPGIY